MSITLKYYIKNSDLPFTIFELIAMYIETYFYQKWIKHCEINNKFKIDIIQILTITLFLTDLFLVILLLQIIISPIQLKNIYFFF